MVTSTCDVEPFVNVIEPIANDLEPFANELEPLAYDLQPIVCGLGLSAYDLDAWLLTYLHILSWWPRACMCFVITSQGER